MFRQNCILSQVRRGGSSCRSRWIESGIFSTDEVRSLDQRRNHNPRVTAAELLNAIKCVVNPNDAPCGENEKNFNLHSRHSSPVRCELLILIVNRTFHEASYRINCAIVHRGRIAIIAARESERVTRRGRWYPLSRWNTRHTLINGSRWERLDRAATEQLSELRN